MSKVITEVVSASQASEIVRTQGFALVEQAISGDEVSRYTAELERCIEEDRAMWTDDLVGRVDAYMVQNLMLRSNDFARYLGNPTLHEVVDDLLEDTSIVYAFTSSSMPPSGTNFSHRVHVDCPRVIPGYPTNVGVILALDSFTPENGATWFLPASFERLDEPSWEEFMAGAVQVLPSAGQLIVFNARTWHVGGENTTDKVRHAITLNACRSFMRQRFDFPRMVSQETLDAMDDVGRRFLGMDVQVPASMDEYLLPPAQRSQKR